MTQLQRETLESSHSSTMLRRNVHRHRSGDLKLPTPYQGVESDSHDISRMADPQKRVLRATKSPNLLWVQHYLPQAPHRSPNGQSYAHRYIYELSESTSRQSTYVFPFVLQLGVVVRLFAH